MISAGIELIITHPERNAAFIKNPNWLFDWLRKGCLVQLTAGSLSGRFGKKAENMSHMLLERNLVHFVASDALSLEKRPPMMASAYELLKKSYGQATADRLCIHNPYAAFIGSRMPDQPEPLGLSDASKSFRGGRPRRSLGHP